MPLSDQVLELVFAFLLEKGDGKTNEDLRLASLPACQLLRTRRMRGFDHVEMELLRRGLKWALRAKDYWKLATRVSKERLEGEKKWIRMYQKMHAEADRLSLDRAFGAGNWDVEDFREPAYRPENHDFVVAFSDPEVVRYL